MIALETKFVSEAMKPGSPPAVRDWLDEQAAETLYLSSVTIAEMLVGIGVLPDRRRKQNLAATLDGMLDLIEGRILPFDTDAARRHTDLAVAAGNVGKCFPTTDAYTAAIATIYGFAVATRDESAFKAAGVPIIDPWATGA